MKFTQEIVVLILGGGGAVAIFTLVKAFLAIRSSADTRETAAIGNLEKWTSEANTRAVRAYSELVHEREMTAYWQRRAAQVEHIAVRAGCDVPPPPPPPLRRHGVEVQPEGHS